MGVACESLECVGLLCEGVECVGVNYPAKMKYHYYKSRCIRSIGHSLS